MKYADKIFKEIEEREIVDTTNYIVDDGWEDYIREKRIKEHKTESEKNNDNT